MAAVMVAGAMVAPVDGHHSIAMFDGRRVVQVTGVVTGFRWINPHVTIEIDEKWTVEMQAPTTLMGDGWKRDTLAVGDRITVFVSPLRVEDPAAPRQRGQYVGVVLPDGSKLGRTDEVRN